MTDDQKRQRVLDFFNTHQIPFELYEHPAFFTVAEAHKIGDVYHRPGVVGAKNLFLRNIDAKKAADGTYPDARYYLYTLPDVERADLKAFAASVGEKKFTFASPSELLACLGVTPGSVSLCGLLNDTEGRVRAHVHPALLSAEKIHLHPNVNTASLELSHEAFMRFLSCVPHTARYVK